MKIETTVMRPYNLKELVLTRRDLEAIAKEKYGYELYGEQTTAYLRNYRGSIPFSNTDKLVIGWYDKRKDT